MSNRLLTKDEFSAEVRLLTKLCNEELMKEAMDTRPENRPIDMDALYRWMLSTSVLAPKPKLCLSCGAATQPCCGH